MPELAVLGYLSVAKRLNIPDDGESRQTSRGQTEDERKEKCNSDME